MHRGNINLMGFVSYMKRRDAETAVREMDGLQWGGKRLQVGFSSRPVPIPSRALYGMLEDWSKAERTEYNPRAGGRPRSRSRSPVDRGSRDNRRSRSRNGTRSPRTTRPMSDSRSLSGSRSPSPRRNAIAKWLDSVPAEESRFIRDNALDVRERGKSYEVSLRERERSNPRYAFLFNEKLAGYHLYQSTLDSRYRVPTPPPEDFDDNVG